MRLEDRQQTLERILPLVEKQDDLTRARVLGYIEGMAAANAGPRRDKCFKLKRIRRRKLA